MTAIATPDVLETVGRFEHGQIVLDSPPTLPEGTELHIRITVRQPKKPRKLSQEFFDLTAGQFPELERLPQGEYEVREPLE